MQNFDSEKLDEKLCLNFKRGTVMHPAVVRSGLRLLRGE